MAMKIKILGPGCPNCRKLYAEAAKAIAASGATIELQKVERIEEIMTCGVFAMPGLIIDDEIKASGRVPRSEEILSWIKSASKTAAPDS